MKKSQNEIVEKEKLTFLGKYIIPWAIKYRNDLVMKYVTDTEGALLDIGGGKGYLIRNCACKKSISLDQQGNRMILKDDSGEVVSEKKTKGTDVKGKIPFKDGSFDYVTMVALIEHLKDARKLVEECHRVMKPDGLLIMTTPFPIVERIVAVLDRGSDQLSGHGVEDDHEQYYDLKSMNKLVGKHFKKVKYKRFQLGVNQLFVYEKK